MPPTLPGSRISYFALRSCDSCRAAVATSSASSSISFTVNRTSSLLPQVSRPWGSLCQRSQLRAAPSHWPPFFKAFLISSLSMSASPMFYFVLISGSK